MLAEPLTDSGPKQRMVIDQQNPDPANLFFRVGLVGRTRSTARIFADQLVASRRPYTGSVSFADRKAPRRSDVQPPRPVCRCQGEVPLAVHVEPDQR